MGFLKMILENSYEPINQLKAFFKQLKPSDKQELNASNGKNQLIKSIFSGEVENSSKSKSS